MVGVQACVITRLRLGLSCLACLPKSYKLHQAMIPHEQLPTFQSFYCTTALVLEQAPLMVAMLAELSMTATMLPI